MTKEPYQIIDVTEENLKEHNLFCFQSKKNTEGYQGKVAWFKERFKEGMRIKILNVLEGERGYATRGFIEYIPGEYNWRGIDAKGYLVIHCIWVVGKNKGKGYGTRLLEKCLEDAKNLNGVAVLTNKKGHWLPKPTLFKKKGFVVAETVYNTFELHVKKFNEDAPNPKFYPIKEGKDEKYSEGFTVFVSKQCPYNPSAIELVEKYAEKFNFPIKVIPIKTTDEAQKIGFHPYGTYCILFNGEFLTYCYQNEKGFTKLLKNKGIDVE